MTLEPYLSFDDGLEYNSGKPNEEEAYAKHKLVNDDVNDDNNDDDEKTTTKRRHRPNQRDRRQRRSRQ